MIEIIALCAMGAVLELDTAYIGQFLVSRPSVAGLLLGFFTGDWFTGLALGFSYEFIFAGYRQVGFYVPPSGFCAVFCSVILCAKWAITPALGFALGLLAGGFFRFVESGIRQYLSVWNEGFAKDASCPRNINFWIVKSALIRVCAVFVFLFSSVYILAVAGIWAQEFAPAQVLASAKSAYAITLFIGFGVLLSLPFRKRMI